MRALKQIHINGGIRRCIHTVVVDVADNADDGQQPNVTIHISELNGVANGVLVGPACARQGLADDGKVGRIGAIAVIENSSAKERNPESLEVAFCRDTEISRLESLFLAEKNVEFAREGF